jgi:hypothetical protein
MRTWQKPSPPLVDFKKQARDEFAIIVELLCDLFSTLTPEKALDFLHLQFAAAIGLYQMTDLPDL